MRSQEKKVIQCFNEGNWEKLVLHSEIPVFVDFLFPERPASITGSPDLLRLGQEWAGVAEAGYLDVSRDLSLVLKYPIVHAYPQSACKVMGLASAQAVKALWNKESGSCRRLKR